MENQQTICSVEGCDKRRVAKGYCMTHYQQAHKGKLVQATEQFAQQPIPATATQEMVVEPKIIASVPVIGVVTKEVVTSEVLRWQVGERSVPINELSHDDMRDAIRSLFETNGRLRSDFEREIGEIAEAYEQKINSLYHVLAASVELELREAMRDKMDMILEVVAAEVERRQSIVINDKEEETDNGH